MTLSGEHPAAEPSTDSFAGTAFCQYHRYTKHTPQKLYANPYSLDWNNQPDPFRHYEGAPIVALPIPRRPEPQDYFHIHPADRPAPIILQTIADLLYYSMAISAWKEVPRRNVRWSLRVNPSSGNLHPTETHLIARGIEGLPDGCYHFRVDEFALEARHQGRVDGLLAALADCSGLPSTPLMILLSSIFWREAWKYRDRAFRYCHLDLGHAVAAVAEALTGLGWRPQCRHCFDDDRVSRLLGLAGTDERPGALLCAGPALTDLGLHGLAEPILFRGQPNRLSRKIITYDSIEQVYAATRSFVPANRPSPAPLVPRSGQTIPLSTTYRSPFDFWHVVRTRRSGISFDGHSATPLDQLGALLYRAAESIPSDVMSFRHDRPGPWFVHLFLYIHRVTGLPPGIYYYDRGNHQLLLLHAGDVRGLAGQLSLQQGIASDSSFAVSMVADFNTAWRAFGERAYRAVHLEAGYIGQGLYLGAESIGTNATGIGAFFDDDANRTLGLPPGLEVIYHFTVGKALPDDRVQQKKAYAFEPDHAPGEVGPGAPVQRQ